MSDLNEMISCCGSDCSTCYCYGEMCKGCNAVCGKVFHAPDEKECVRGKMILPSHGKEFLHPTVRTFYMPR